ncbi:MAG: tyrosine-type recombinase/integrase [Acidimicrobiales bacterium]
MSDLASHLRDYLGMRRALGFKLRREGTELPQLVAYVEAAGSATVTTDLAMAWARLPDGVHPVTWAHRLGMARGFAAYLRTIDPATEVPPHGVFPASAPRRAPYLWSGPDIARLMEAARQLSPPLRAATHEALFGLVAVTGMRLGEAIGLGRDDVDLVAGVLTVGEPKGGRVRLLPLHPSSTEALRNYAGRRDRLCPSPRSATFFLSSVGTALLPGGVHRTFNLLTTAMGLRTATVRPRIHDLRHSFAVATLVDWHRRGADVEGRMAVLSTYLGHVNPTKGSQTVFG